MEWDGIVTRHQSGDCKLEARSLIVEDFLLCLTLLIMSFMSSFNLPRHSLDPTDFLGSFDFKNDLLGRAWGRPNSEIDGSRHSLSGVVDWPCGLDHHVAVVVLRARVNVSHYYILFYNYTALSS